LHAVAFRLKSLAAPARVLRRQDVALRVRHQAQHPTGGVAQSRHVALRAIGVHGVTARLTIGVAVAQHYLSRLLQALQNPLLAPAEPSLAVADRRVLALAALQEGAAV